ncbi:hypothetical protein NDU88_007030 [Pleurodeles waltl]|uniref:Uncharacterized protein n=1 Tax=Pleurodeles waltl TaxID=8319 RepID=A0AAV7URS6_PLEWA|nr:hypothetical protein NDU88_007030 [Pleurodeles waltl]
MGECPGGTTKSYIWRNMHANPEIQGCEAAPEEEEEERSAKKDGMGEKEADEEDGYGRDPEKVDTRLKDPRKEEDTENRKEVAGKRQESVGGPGQTEHVGKTRSQTKEADTRVPRGTKKSYIRRNAHANPEIEGCEVVPEEEERRAKKEDASEKEADEEDA